MSAKKSRCSMCGENHDDWDPVVPCYGGCLGESGDDYVTVNVKRGIALLGYNILYFGANGDTSGLAKTKPMARTLQLPHGHTYHLAPRNNQAPPASVK